MNDLTDQQLLRDYAERQSEAAFAAIVHRYVDLAYSAAFRMVGDIHAAKDVTQAVFVALAQNARQLTDRPALAGWLHGTARNLAVKAIRSDVRRRAREQEAAVMNELLSASPDTRWEYIAPHLDEALGELSEPEREAVLLRYFKNHDLRTVGATLGISDDAAQKRVSRAVERLREFFAKRGVTVGASGLAVVISANAVQAAPMGLALAISAAATLTGTTLATTATLTATKAIAMTALQKTIVTATVAVLTGAGIYEARHAALLRAQVQTLQQQQAALTETIKQLQEDRDDAANRVALLTKSPPKYDKSASELLRLRGEVGRLRRESTEANVPITHDTVESRYQNAQKLARNGNSAAALNEFLWCFDEGMPRVSGYGGVRTSFLLSSIAKLGEKYPAALAALRERRDKASQRLLTSENDSDAAMDFAAINRTLKEDQNTLAIFDQLPAEDRRRQTLASAAYNQLVEAQRYDDALLGRPYANISAQFEMGSTERPLPANVANPEMIRKSQRDYLINSTAKSVEVLAGSGDLVHARALAGGLLEYDNTPETLSLLQQHVSRAGQAGLLESVPKP